MVDENTAGRTINLRGLGKEYTQLVGHDIVKPYNIPMTLNKLSQMCHTDNAKWWTDLFTGERIERNKGELIALMHSELSEALEGVRKDLQDEKLPHRKAEEVELADCLIRIFDYAGAYGLDLEGAFWEKRAYNAKRADHKPENRVKEGGKKF